MANNLTQIPAIRVPIIDSQTGLMSREWYRFFVNLFDLTGEGSNVTSLADLQVGPPTDTAVQIGVPYTDLSPRDELGTLASKNSVSLTTDVSGVLPTANGGANATAVATASVTSPLAWDSSSYSQYALTALANALTINADANAAPVDGQKMTFRLKDNGTARALTWTTGSAKSFQVIGTTLPTTTVANKTVYVGCSYNAADSRWDVLAVGQEV
jgi:hypothetical protein